MSMLPDDFTDDLNAAQQQAVTSLAQYQLILAGAGSGKTRVLVYRIAWLLKNGYSPFHILAVTFTNKAANEMRGRIEKLLRISTRGMWVGTFHGMAHRLLRIHFSLAKLPETFTVLDSDDQIRLIKQVLMQLSISEEDCVPKEVQYYINQQKEEGARSNKRHSSRDKRDAYFQQVYSAYEKACETQGCVDFSELLLRAYELLKNNMELCEQYQSRFRHILVDEFQDTNTIQYQFLRSLTSATNAFTAVGDDDQSIYGWRGARIENMQSFHHDFPNAAVIRLEQNYRSTATILNASNHLITHNQARLGKTLWTSGEQGDPISLYRAFNEVDEARFAMHVIRKWYKNGYDYQNIAILYRSNVQSRVLEEVLMREAIPYKIYGGHRFFDRAEIKDVLAYLRLTVNTRDDVAFERVINWPTRGIGDKTLEVLRMEATKNGVSLWTAAESVLTTTQGVLSKRAVTALAEFLDLILALSRAIVNQPVAQQIEIALGMSGLLAHYKSQRGTDAEARLENLQELVAAAREFTPSEEDASENITPLHSFLAQAMLVGTHEGPEGNVVHLMTVHAAKGLEFPVVIIVGVEQGLFPHRGTLYEPDKIEEERRLCYVGMTRAMKKLYLVCAEQRRLYGQTMSNRPSQFLKELPPECIKNENANLQRESTDV